MSATPTTVKGEDLRAGMVLLATITARGRVDFDYPVEIKGLSRGPLGAEVRMDGGTWFFAPAKDEYLVASPVTAPDVSQSPTAAQAVCDEWNARFPEGTLVRYWRGARDGEPSGEGKTYTSAHCSLSGHPVIYIVGCSGFVALSHVEPVER